MAITIQLPDGRRREFQHDPITIGRSPDCQIQLTDAPVLQDQHARVRKLAGRWLVESLGDWPLQAGTDVPARLCWLKIGDTIRLTQDGPELIFEPALEDVVLDAVAPHSAAYPPERSAPASGPASDPAGPPPLPGVQVGRTGPPPLPNSARAPGSIPPPLPDRVPGPRSTPPPLPSQGRAKGSGPPPLPDGYSNN